MSRLVDDQKRSARLVSQNSKEDLGALANQALIEMLQNAAASSDILSEEPDDKYARCTENILKAILALR